MAYKVLVTNYAEIDIDEAISWYNKIEESLSSRLIVELYTVFSLISINPEIFRARYKNIRLFIKFKEKKYSICSQIVNKGCQ
jgi:plasmid stabilization system protein ParE